MDGRLAAEEAMLQTYLVRSGSAWMMSAKRWALPEFLGAAAHHAHGDRRQSRNRQLVARDVLLDQAAHGLEAFEFSLRWR